MRLILLLSLASTSALAVAVNPSPAAKTAFDRGEKEFEAGRYSAAAAAYQDALKATPKWAPALTALGSAQFKLNKCDKLLADAEKPAVCVDAVGNFKAAAESDPGYALAWFNLGYASRKLQDFKTAASAYEKYTALDKDPDGLFGLGESYRQLGEKEKAIAAYQRYLAAESRPSEQKWIDRAKDAIEQLKVVAAPVEPAPKQQVRAAPAAEPVAPRPAPTVDVAAPASAPASTDALPQVAQRRIEEGDRLMAEKKYREASFAYQDAVNSDPNNIQALFQLGKAYAVLGYYSQAIERWSRVEKLSTEPGVKKNAQDNIALAQKKMAQVGGGSPQSQGKTPGSGPVADSTRQQARAYYEQGVRLIGAGDYTNALANLSECLRLEPALTVGYIARGSALIGLRRYAEAATDYQYAMRLDPTLAAPLYGIAEAYWGMNRSTDAKQYYEKYVASAATDTRTDLQTDARKKLEQLRNLQSP